jgi:3-oxoacyl-[acyl-carrier protein] reductase
MRLEGRVAIVTGASRGIGQGIALAFAREGADVVVNYLGSTEQAQQMKEQLLSMGRGALAIQADVSSASDVERMVLETVDTLGRVDVLVNNAGVIEPFDFGAPDYDKWQRMVDVNVKGMLLCSRSVAGYMREQGGGRIVNIVVKETRGSLDYTLTKAAGEVLTRGLARELAPSILVNAIAPGYIDTGWISELDEEAQASIRQRTLLGKWGLPEHVAGVAVFLASDDSSYLTGTTILVDGGAALA